MRKEIAMAAIEQTPQNFYHLIAHNVQKGDAYAIKFKNDPVVYVGVPVLDRTGGDNEFTFQIMEPKEKKGVVVRPIDSIELMKEQ
jgi:hypothetical protein